MVTGYADRVRVLEARDAGVTELIVKPVTANAVLTRLNQVIYKPRPFARTEDYYGPDRRRRSELSYNGPLRRHLDLNPKTGTVHL
jgi:DNA-binding response OmpR family regulator